MRVSIWDLDYYYDASKKHNDSLMRISSYHKQKGDVVNFVLNESDILRPYDIYYISKELKNVQNPPLQLFTDRKVRWLGEAFKIRQNFRLSDTMLACRPDYLLYPELETRADRAEYIQLLNNNLELIEISQDWRNSFRNKDIIVTDQKLWYAKPEIICAALNKISDVKGISFAEPIWGPKLNDPQVWEAFKQLQLTRYSKITWQQMNAAVSMDTLKKMNFIQQKFPKLALGDLPIKYASRPWRTIEEARAGFENLVQIVLYAKKNRIKIKILAPKSRYSTPFFWLVELLEDWTSRAFKLSWLEYLSHKFYINYDLNAEVNEWNKPQVWPTLFRDAIRQTYQYKDFLLRRWGSESVWAGQIPWTLWEEEFKQGL